MSYEADSARGAEPVTPVFAAVYREQFPYVFRSLRRLGVRPSELDDLVQEVFTVVFRRLGDYDPSRPIEPWLFGIAFRTVSVFRRTRSRRIVEVPSDDIEPTDEAAGPETSLQDRQARLLVLRALEALDLDQRAVFVLHDIDGVIVPKIAETLEIPLNTVYSRLRAARARFASRVRMLNLVEAAPGGEHQRRGGAR